ncbi:MAG: phosphate ABC transporter permease PstA, partial [Bdellovibrio sp.]
MQPSQDILANIKRRQFWDFVFAILGLLSLLFALVTLLALIIDLAVTGVPRINAEFFTSFPSRFADKAGILSAWVGSFLIMLTTAFCAIPLGIAAGVYLEEYSKKNWISH